MLDKGGANCFVGLLGSLAAGVVLAGVAVLLTEIIEDEFLCGAECQGRQVGGIGSHVGDETFLIEALCQTHGGADRKMEFAGRFLLKSRSSERRSGIARAFRLVDRRDCVLRPYAFLEECGRIFRIGKTCFQYPFQLGACETGELPFYLIVRLWFEGHYLSFAVHDKPERNALDASGRKPSVDLLPKYRRELETHQAVEYAAGLLRVYEVHVHFSGIPDGAEDGILGNLMECYAPGAVFIESQGLHEMPGNGLSFAVFIGSQPYYIGLLRKFAQLGNNPLLVVRNDVFRRESSFYVDA